MSDEPTAQALNDGAPLHPFPARRCEAPREIAQRVSALAGRAAAYHAGGFHQLATMAERDVSTADALVPGWRWYLVELVPIGVQEAYERLPGLRAAAREDMGYVRGREWFWCRNFDAERNLCRVHDDKPAACSGFPWYNRPPTVGALLPYPSCGYYADVVRTQANIERGTD